MARITRKEPSKHIVVPDTNVLWHKEKSQVVAPDFDKFWDEHLKAFDLELVVPEVVEGELLFQQTSSALRALGRANEDIAHVSSVAGSKYSHRITEARVRRNVKERFQKWVQRRGAAVHPTPVASIDWPKLIESAIWRRAPFSEDHKQPEIEKGFRDALILETVREICRSREGSIDVAFLCGDALLRRAAEAELKSFQRCSFYESLEDFSAYLKLTKEALTIEFVRSIQARASAKFYTENDRDCLMLKEEIVLKIRQGFPGHFENPTDAIGSFSGLLGVAAPGHTWEPSASEQIWFTMARFHELKGRREFHWINVVSFVQPFRYVGPPSFLVTDQDRKARLRVLRFEVEWKADVKRDGRFHGVTVENLRFVDRKFEAPTEDQVKRFGLEETPVLGDVVK